MENQDSPTRPDSSPDVMVRRMASSVLVAKALFTVAELGVADHLGDGEARDVVALAAASGAMVDPLYRILRMLSTRGVFREVEPGRFEHTAMSHVLRSDHPSRARAAVMLSSGPLWWRGLDHLTHTVRTGETSFEASVGRNFFDYLADHRDLADGFDEAMAGIHDREQEAVCDAYEFSALRSVVDVGGGTGGLLLRVLRRNESIRGLLLEEARASRKASERIEAEGLGDRCQVIEGDFFESVPEGHDAYVLSHVIHDWDESRCARILTNCRRSMKRGSRLLIIEMLVPPPGESHPSKMVDIAMLAITGGRERTEEEYRSLLAANGLRLDRVIPTSTQASILEACRDDEPAEPEHVPSVPLVPWV